MADDIFSQMFADDDRFRARVNLLDERTPQRAAAARRVSRVSGVPPAVVEQDFATYEREVLRRQTDAAIERDPWLARYFRDPDNAAIARDDAPQLSALGELLRPWTNEDRDQFLGRLTGRPQNNIGEVSRRAVRQMLGTQPTPRLLQPRPSEQPFAETAARARNIPVREVPLPTDIRIPLGRNAEWSLLRGAAGATAMFGRAGLRTLQGALGLEQMGREIVGLDGSGFAQAQADVGGWIEAITPEMGGLQRDVVSGLESATQMVAFGAVGGARAALLGLTSQTTGEAYGRYRQRGATIAQAATGGLAEGAIELVTERYLGGLNYLFSGLGREAGQGFVRGYLIPELVGEQLATHLQDAVDTAIANPDMTWDRYWEQRPAAALSTAISTATMIGVLGGGRALAARLQPQQRDLDDMAAGLAGQNFLDRLMTQAEQSQVRELDADSFSAFVRQRTDGTSVQEIYIPVEAVDTYFQTEGAETEFFEPYEEQLAEARRLNGDLVVPIGEALARLAGTKVWTAIREDVRVTPGGMSGREAREKAKVFMQEVEARGAEIAREALAEGEEMAPAAEVYQQVRQELLAVGRGEREADAIAQLVASRREAAGARLGMTALEYHEANPIRFREAEPGEKPGENALLSREDPVQAVLNIGLATADGTGITEEEAKAALEEIGVIIRGSIVAQSDTEPTLVARINRPLTPDEGMAVSTRLRQEAIAQRAGEKGDLFGPKAEEWGPFNPDFFLTETGARLSDVLPRAGWTEERVGGLIDSYTIIGGANKGKTTAWATLMSPDQFLGLTASERGREKIFERISVDPEFRSDWLAASKPIFIQISRGQHVTNVMGHEGRHRMTRLKKEGIALVPVVVYNVYPVEDDLASLDLLPQRSKPDASMGGLTVNWDTGDQPTTVTNLIPINWKNRDRLIELGRGARVLFQQDTPGRVRGQAQFGDGPGAVVTLFENVDLSTLIHELGHVFLEEMVRDAGAKGAPQELKEDVAKLKAWFAGQGHPVRGRAIPIEAHELFARGFERYAMEGKAPTSALRKAFAQFRAWLLRIYEVVENLNAPITPEVREVFDRMLATREAIDANQETALPLFKSAETAGMTEQEFAAYTKSIQGARDEAYDALLFRTMAAIRNRENQRMREQRANVRAEVAAEINAKPEFIALHLLRTGRWLGDPEREPVSVKINTGWLIDNYGDEVLKALPRGLPITHGAGRTGDEIAELVGMASGDQLVRTLIAMREASDRLRLKGEKRTVRDLLIENEVDRVMAARHGDVMTDGSIEEEAIAAINSARQGEIIAGEMRQLTKRKSVLGSPTPYQIAREWAKRTITAGRVVDVASRAAVQRYIRATQRAARAAEEAILKDDVDEAFRQKQAQLLNHALLAEAKAAADQVDLIVARMKRLAGQKARKSVDQDYFDRIHELLERFDFRPRSQRSIDEQNSFEAWAARQRDKGFEVLTPPRLAGAEHFSRTSVDTLYELDDAVKSLLHLGRLKQNILDGIEERDFNELRDEIAAHVQQLPDRKLPDSPVEEEKRRGAQAAAALLKIETIADELDNQNPNGPMNRLLVQGASRAAVERDELAERTLVPIAQLFKSLSKQHRKSMHDKITSDRLTWNALREGDPRLGNPVTLTRMEWIGVALNTGNISNLEKMSKGERWPAPVIQAELTRILKKEDWDFVQAVWDNVAKLWPDIARVEREMSGVVPEEVTPLEIETPFGPYRGGYFPVVYDVARSQVAENNAADEANDLFGFKSGIGTPKGHTITRTEAFGPLTYRVEEVLIGHIEKVTTRIAYAQWVRDVVRVIDNPKVRGIIDTKLGAEYRRQIRPWLQRQITSYVDRRGVAWWDKTLRQFRVNMSITTMGLAYSTGVAQTLGLGFSAGRIGPRYVAIGLKRLLAERGGAQEFVFSRSPEMQRRGRELNREVVEVFQALRQKHGWYTQAQAMAFWHIAMIDRYMVAMPTWLGAHQKALDEGMTDEQASAYADKIVRNSQGSGREKDLSAIQSPSGPMAEAGRFFTMYYTPFNVLFNAQWDSVRAARAGDWRRSMLLTTWFIGTTALADALMVGDYPWDDDEERAAMWFARNVFFSLWTGVPIARDIANYSERRWIGEYSNLATPVESMWTAVERAKRENQQVFVEDEAVTSEWVRANSNAIGYLFGLPGGQIGKTGGFLWDVQAGGAQPEDVRDWYVGVTSGRMPAEE